jgi:CLN3 protein
MGQLLGVAMISAQTALGEASLLALAGKQQQQQQQQALHQCRRRNEDNVAANNASSSLTTTTCTTISTSYRSRFRSRSRSGCSSLTYFASGTGLAGPLGYLWTMTLVRALRWSLPSTCFLAAVVLTTLYYHATTCIVVLLTNTTTTTVPSSLQAAVALQDEDEEEEDVQIVTAAQECVAPMMLDTGASSSTRRTTRSAIPTRASSTMSMTSSSSAACSDHVQQDDDDDDEAVALVHFQVSQSDDAVPHDDDDDMMTMIPIASMTTRQRSRLVLRLWKYMIPLFVVYAAEYACQGGAWTAIGLNPEGVASKASRQVFYTNANWLYQAGVFVSRSSGSVCPTISLPMLWFLPAWQVLHFVLFTWIAAHGSDNHNDHSDESSSSFFLYKASILYTMAFVTGLLGGAVYIHGYQRIVADYSPSSPSSSQPRRSGGSGDDNNNSNTNNGHAEFALATVSVAESFGILVANVMSLFVQACLYQVNHLSGAIATCPLDLSSS